jgi:AcrR family transcriptional regulator
MAESVQEKGFRETFVRDVVRIARTSRSSFYEHFDDRQACFLALFDAVNDAVIGEIVAAVRADRPWQEQVDAAVGAYIDAVAARPALWRSFIREIPALGEAGAERQRQVMGRFADLLVALVEAGLRAQPIAGAHPLTKDMGLIIAGGFTLLVVMAAEEGRDMEELKPIAAGAFKAIMTETVLHPRGHEGSRAR